ncbi:DNA-methyltransferase [Shouchella clausii]|uniref:DNA-methyltransferase n=1 Tax=Shouchella clausii TaxID=79880 RepID=UPI001652BCB0|nr:site-specific DNA-methyltransferase [Shouchella clausii]QNM43727.1 site-specific DNA-methyltransferase [Shouchella clausii]
MTEVFEGIELNRIYNEDCLIGSERIEGGSVDLILTDLPYGTVTNIGDSTGIDHGMKGKTSWDMPIEPSKIYEIANRILRKNGKMVLFSQEPYTTRLISEAIPNVPFSYRMIWEKDHFANGLIAKKAPVSYYEDVLVFSKLGGLEISGINGNHPLKKVFNDALDRSGKSKRFYISLVGSSASHYFTDGVQFRVPTESKFNVIKDYIDIDYSYEELKEIDAEYKFSETKKHYEEYPRVFNLWEGGKYKSNILRYKKDYDGYHPTQKPVLLLEDLIKTFSNEGDTVVDLTIGSGSTAVAAINTNRNFIGFELEKEYVDIANKRIDEALEKRKKG